MSCFSRLLGLLCAVVPGLLFLAFSALFFTRWPQLGFVTGPLYSLASFITGAVCLYLGIGILFGRDRKDESAAVAPQTLASNAPVANAPIANAPVANAPIIETTPLQAAPLPVVETVAIAKPPGDDAATSPPSVADSTEIVATEIDATEVVAVPAPPDSPEMRIRQLAKTRPNWRVSAPQLAHAANLNLGVADATAREMVNSGQAQLQIGPNGETIYIFDLA